MPLIKGGRPAPSSRVGPKARNLQLLSSRFDIPEFIIIPVDYYTGFIKNRSIPDDLTNELQAAISPWLNLGPVAVRSSAAAEDLPNLSFAGMYETVLGAGDLGAVFGAIIKVWDSNDSERVRAYCRQHGIKPGPMAVIIQRQLDPETSGVMVTRGPITGDEMVIECCRGLGAALVSGQVEPVRYRFRNDQVVKPDGPGLLNDRQVRELADAGRKIEGFFGSPQDIEWAFEKNRLFILQARPLTVSGGMPRRHCTVWSNVNVRETIPDPITPMGWSLFTDFIFYSIIHDVFTIPVTEQQYQEYPMVERLLGRMYWNLNNCMSYAVSLGPILRFFKISSLDPQISDAVRAVDYQNLPQPISAGRLFFWGPMALFRLTRFILKSFIRYRAIKRRNVRRAEEALRYEQGLEISRDPEQGLANANRWLHEWFAEYGQEYFGFIFVGLFQLMTLIALLKWRMGKKGETLARNAVLGIIDKTGEMAMAIQKLGALGRERLKRDTISRKDLASLVASDPVFQKEYRAFLDDFGHRGPSEFDVGQPNWIDDQNLAFDVIRAAARARPYAVDRNAEMKKLEAELTPLARWFFRLIRPRMEALTPLRENSKHNYFRFGRHVKDQLLAIGETLVAREFCGVREDVFFLTLSDLALINERKLSAADCRRLIAQRKGEWQENASVQAPDIIYESGERIRAALQTGSDHAAEPLTFGRIRARARIIADFGRAPELKKDEILVTHHSDPGWTPLFMVAGGVVVEVGGLICHAAMVARELGIPAVVLKNATRLIPDGAEIELDADRGRVTIIGKK